MASKLSNKLCIDQLDLKNKRVLVRVNFSVPMKNGKVANAHRIDESLKTIQYALSEGAKSVVIICHLEHPGGKRVEKLSLKPVAEIFQEKFKKEVLFLDDCVGEEVEKICADPTPGSVIFLENLRFHVEEEGKGVGANGEKIIADKEAVKKFRESLTKLGDVYINEAFGNVHRSHSSLVGINLEKRAAGFLIKKELTYFAKAMENPERPYLAIVGGAKVADKIHMIINLLTKVDEMIIGGAMAFTFLKVLNGMNIGKSLIDNEGAKIVHEIMAKATSQRVKIHFPVDFVTATKFTEDAEVGKVVTVEQGVPDDWIGLDIGPQSSENFSQVIARAKTMLWNGPMGVFEWDNFDKGTKRVLDSVIEATGRGALTIIGGGDTTTALAKFGAEEKVTHISTGGGATLALLGGEELPAIDFLSPAPTGYSSLT